MTNAEIAERLRRLPNNEIRTLSHNIRNEILEVGPDYVILMSEESQTGSPRRITFHRIRRGGTSHGNNSNGRIVDAIRVAIGMD